MAAAMVAGSDWSANSAIGRGCCSVERRMSSIASRLGLSIDTTTTSGSRSRTGAGGIGLAHARCEVLRAPEPRQQAIAGRRQPGLDDFGAGGIVVDQQDGQGLGHLARGATSMPLATGPC